jgi:RND superfamily putative drug exporter
LPRLQRGHPSPEARRAGVTERLAGWCSAHPRRTLGTWALAIVFALAAVAFVMGELTTESHVSGAESQRAESLIAESFPPDPKRIVTDIIVIRSESYRVDDRAFYEFVHRNHVAAKRTGVVINARSYFERRDPVLVSRDGHATIIPLYVKTHDEIEPIVDLVARADADPNFAVSMTGDHTVERDFDELSQHDLKSGELQYGVPAALLVLLLVFGAVVAGLVPLLLAIVSIVVALGIVALLSQPFDLSLFILNMLTGMGLALGIDYSLFVISRYREERGRGREPGEAITAAGATASRAVLFSGTAFVIAMFGLLLVPASIMRSLALGAIVVGVVSVVAALTLLPALLGLLGDRVNALRIPVVGASLERRNPEGRFWRAVIERVLRRPALSLTLAVALLVAAATPVFGMQIGQMGVSTMPDRFVAKRGFLALERDFPQATTDPVRIVVDGATGAKARAGVRRVAAALAADPRFGEAQVQQAEGVVLLTAPIRGDADSNAAVAAVRELRADVVRPALAGTGAVPYVGGTSAENGEYFDAVTDPAPSVFAFVLGLTLVLLTVAFRSLVVAGTAIVLNLLSVGAAYGLLVLVFQHGVGAGVLGFQQVESIDAWIPLFLFAVLFGLSMDYQVFLLSRIKERYDEVGDTAQAVAFGVATTARIITGAALIIVAVFAGFAMGDYVGFQQMGFGVGIALLIDATVIRSIILPSAMRLLGRRTWYLPGWLQWLPRLQIEGRRAALVVTPGTSGVAHPRQRRRDPKEVSR